MRTIPELLDVWFALLVEWYAYRLGRPVVLPKEVILQDDPWKLALAFTTQPLVDRETWGEVEVDEAESARLTAWAAEDREPKPQRERPAAWANREDRELPKPLWRPPSE